MDLKGHKILIMGLANERSIAFGVLKTFKEAGAEIALTYIDAVEKRLRPIAEEMKVQHLIRCDVSSDEDLKNLGQEISRIWPEGLDGLVHSVAFADRADLERRFLETSRGGFQLAMDVSAYSLIAAMRAVYESLKKKASSVITMTYYGSEKVVTNYNVMGVAKAALEANVRYLAADCGPEGVRVNAISAGPIRTLAASGVKDFKSILGKIESQAPLRRNVDIDQVAGAALFLASKASAGVTGEVLFVDSGYHIMGL
jgi:enoyl-[acyl-carrier protein] reductase I